MVDNALVIGLGVSGRSVVRYLLAKGISCWGYDDARERQCGHPDVTALLQQGLRITDKVPEEALSYAVVSPGVALTHPICREVRGRSIPLIGEVEFACRHLLHHSMVGITGTNGKTTVTLQVAHTLSTYGIAARAVGNVGVPLTDLLRDESLSKDTVLVVELSSYQLEMLECRCLDIAVVLNITPDHLDRYGDMEAYAAAKWRIAGSLKAGATLYTSSAVVKSFPPPWQKGVYPFDGGEGSSIDYERANLLAVYAAVTPWQLTMQQVESAGVTFQKPPHRCQYVATVDGVDFYDDSKGTNIDAVEKAVAALSRQRILLIAGGVAKGASFRGWCKTLRCHVAAIYVIGSSSDQMVAELGESFAVCPCHDLAAAVAAAYRDAAAGDIVLLSPGCASTDMFRDYVHRGETFQQLVRDLSRE